MSSHYLDIPVFPLPNLTFFPQTLLPLHIFEDRYRAMIASCLQGDRMLGVALLRDGWQRDYFGKPPIFKTFGVGKIVDHVQLDDGRYNIVVEGMHRVRLIEEYEGHSHRVARVEILGDVPMDHRRTEAAEILKELDEQCRRVARGIPKLRGVIQNCWSSHPHPGVIADFLASALVADPYDRQSILEELDPIRRLKLTRVQIGSVLAQLEEIEAVEEEVFEEE